MREPWLIFLTLLLMGVGLLNLYSMEFTFGGQETFSWESAFGRQVQWSVMALAAAVVVHLLPWRIWEPIAPYLYGIGIFLLILPILFGREINGARAWLDLGGIRFQPAEWTKVTTALLLAFWVSRYDFSWKKRREVALLGLLWVLPIGLILLQKDTGTAITYAGFAIGLYRAGLALSVLGVPVVLGLLFVAALIWPWWQIVLGIVGLAAVSYVVFFRRKLLLWHGLVVAVLSMWIAIAQGIYQKVLAPHQRKRIEVLLGFTSDRAGAEWNITQAQIAIRGGGLWGQGFGKGMQSKLNYIPQQKTDFAFCNWAEEWGWIGSVFLLGMYGLLLFRLSQLAEKSRSYFALAYGYLVWGVLFMHIFINVGMILKLLPVIGIPLPFISYGGSAQVGFLVMLAIARRFYISRYERPEQRKN
ncbi:MAG: FtsW/RodA/SpoVE family cell cycle protein [Bacteroidia bacterium]